MGKGIALQFKKKYPEMFTAYQRVCEKRQIDTGKLYLWKSPEKWVLMFPTKKHWRNPSRMEYIESGLQKFVDNYERLGIESIAFPKLGCGNVVSRKDHNGKVPPSFANQYIYIY